MSAEGVAFVADYRPDRADFIGYGAVNQSFVSPITPYLDALGVPWCQPRGALDGWLNVRQYTWPMPQEHVFISHGIADKGYRSPAKLWGFQHIHTSGPWWTDYYKRLGPEGIGSRLFETGYTKLDPLFNGQIPDRVPSPDGRIRVPWAPTHSGINGRSRHYPSTFIELHAQIRKMLPASTFDVVIAPHPRLREAEGLPIKVTLEEYRACDVVVADAGSTLYEAWALDLPVVFPTWIVAGKVKARSTRTLEHTIYSQRLGYHVETPGDLARTVEVAAHGGIGERERDLIEQVLPAAYRGHSGELTAQALAEMVRGDVPRLVPSSFMWIASPDGERFEHVTRKAYMAIWQNKGYTMVTDATATVGRT